VDSEDVRYYILLVLLKLQNVWIYVLEKKSVKNYLALTYRALIASPFYLNEAIPIRAADIHLFPESVNFLTSCLKVAIGI
jgi:hypothetical protein